MTWVKSDDNYPNHPKVKRLSDKAYRLNDHARHYCARNLTDGALDMQDVRVLLAESGASKKHADELHHAGLWDRLPDGYLVHDFLDYNPSREQVLAERAKAKERMKRLRSGERSGEQAGERSGVRSHRRSGTPSRPVEDQKPLGETDAFRFALAAVEASRAASTGEWVA